MESKIIEILKYTLWSSFLDTHCPNIYSVGKNDLKG